MRHMHVLNSQNLFSARQRLQQLHSERAASLDAVCSDASARRMQEGCAAPPICVIHGPFGSGKSTLLVAMLQLFALQMVKPGREKSDSARILVAAHTNVAVDRVLTGLLDHGFTGGRDSIQQSSPLAAIALETPLLPVLRWTLFS